MTEAEPGGGATPTPGLRDPLPEGAVVRFGTTRLRQCDRVTAVAVAPDGGWVAAADRAGCVRAWAVADGGRIADHRLQGEAGALSLAASRDGRLLAVGASDGGVTVLEADGGRVVARGRAFASGVDELRWVRSNDALIALDRSSGLIALLDIDGGELEERWSREVPDLEHVHVSGDSTRLIGIAGGEVRVLDSEDGSEQSSFRVGADDARVVRFGPASDEYAVASDEAVHLVDASGEETGRINIAFASTGERTIRDLAFIDRELLVVLPNDGTVRLVDVHGNERRRFEHGLAVDSMRVSPDARLAVLVTAGRQLRLMDLSTGRSPLRFDAHDGPLRSLAVSPDGSAVATASVDGMVRLWSVRDGSALAALEAGRPVDSVAFVGPDRIATGDRTGELTLWRGDGSTVQHVSTAGSGDAEHAVRSLSASRDGTLLVSTNSRHVQFWQHAPDSSTPLVEQLTFDVRDCSLVALSPDGHTLAASADDARLVRYRPSTEREQGSMGPWVEEQWGEHGQSLRGIAWSPNGERVATVDEAGSVRIWAVNGETLAEMETDAPLSTVAWSPAGDLLAVGRRDGLVELWSAHASAEAPVARLSGHEGAVAGLAFSPDGRLLFSASEDETALGWDVASVHRTRQGARP